MGRTHAETIARIPEIEFAGFVPRELISATLRDPDIDAVDLCIPTDFHAPVAIDALRARKHVLVEKPMALDAASCEQMIAEATSHDRILMVAHVLRFSAPYLALEHVEAVRSASFRRQCGPPDWAAWFADPARSGGGVFDLLIHDADIVLHLFGPPLEISATGSADQISAQLHYPNTAVEISGGWHTPAVPFSMQYTVTTDRGTLHYDSRDSVPSSESPYAAEIRYFADCVRRHKQPARCPPRESARAVRLMRALIAARQRNGEQIQWTSE